MTWIQRLVCGVVLMAVFGLTGCASPRNLFGRSVPTAQPGTILFQDDFSQETSDWGIWEHSGGAVYYAQGGLRILVKDAQTDVWSVAGKNLADVRIESVAKRLDGAADNDFGLICRYQDNQNFYMFLVSSDGYYGIAKLKNNQHSLIGIEQLQYSSKIQREKVSHRLRADCRGEKLSLYVDGVLLMQGSDADFQTGDVGVLAGAYSTSGVDILFDNFIVTQP